MKCAVHSIGSSCKLTRCVCVCVCACVYVRLSLMIRHNSTVACCSLAILLRTVQLVSLHTYTHTHTHTHTLSLFLSRHSYWTKVDKEYRALQATLTTLADTTRRRAMVPFGPKAFMQGELIHTNEVCTLHTHTHTHTHTYTQAHRSDLSHKKRATQ